MKFIFFITLFMVTIACNDNTDKIVSNKLLKKDDYWLADFKNCGLGTMFFYKNDKIYATTTDKTGGSLPNYFYCFDLISGKVLWVNKVSLPSIFNPIVLNDIVYYVTYTSDRYAFDTLGNELWQRSFSNQPDVSLSLSGITFNPINHNLILTGVFGGFYELNKMNGNKVSYTTPSDSAMIVMPKPVFNDNYIYYTNNCYGSEKKLPLFFNYNSLICQDYYTQKIKWMKPFFVPELHSKNGNIFFYRNDSLFSLNGETGNINWKLPLDTLARGGVLFMNDRILCRSTGGKDSGIDYDSGKRIPYLINKRIREYTLTDNHDRKYTVKITLGTFKSNDRFDDACEVQVEKID